MGSQLELGIEFPKHMTDWGRWHLIEAVIWPMAWWRAMTCLTGFAIEMGFQNQSTRKCVVHRIWNYQLVSMHLSMDMYMYRYAYMYVCVSLIYTHTHTHTHTHYTHTHIHIHIHIHIHVYIYIYIYILLHPHTHIYIYIICTHRLEIFGGRSGQEVLFDAFTDMWGHYFFYWHFPIHLSLVW